jgi:hypothetical protein
MPKLKERARGGGQGSTRLTVLAKPNNADSDVQHLWDDDHAAAFYHSLPDLTAAVPRAALTRGQEAASTQEPSTEVPGSDAVGLDSSEPIDMEGAMSSACFGVCHKSRSCIIAWLSFCLRVQ